MPKKDIFEGFPAPQFICACCSIYTTTPCTTPKQAENCPNNPGKPAKKRG
jgi:hypothetical protein